jgi:hypothetical protein
MTLTDYLSWIVDALHLTPEEPRPGATFRITEAQMERTFVARDMTADHEGIWRPLTFDRQQAAYIDRVLGDHPGPGPRM